MFAFSLRAIGIKPLTYKSYAVRFDRQSSSRWALSGVIISLALLASADTPPLKMVRPLIFEIAHQAKSVYEQPLNAVISEVSGYVGFFRTREGLLQELSALRIQNENLLKWQSHAQQLSLDYQALNSHLNLANKSPWPQATAKVIGTQTQEHGDYLLISAGQTQGLVKNQPVITPEGLLGRVVETGINTSRVQRITDLNARTPVKIAGQDADLILSGTSNGLLTVSRQAQTTNYQVGDLLVTSGIGQIYPAGIPVAQVISCTHNRVLAKPLAVSLPDYATVLLIDQDHVA